MGQSLPFSEIDNYFRQVSPTNGCLVDTNFLIALTDKDHHFHEDAQSKNENGPYLTDTRIKKCKQSFLPKTQSGQIGWIELCREFLDGKLQNSWNEVVSVLSINYIDMRAAGTNDLFRKELKWESMYKLSEVSAMGSNDAKILNLLDSSIFNFVVTSDYDIAYGTILSTSDRTALVPDRVYRNHIKKLKF